MKALRFFAFPLILWIVSLVALFAWGGWAALGIAIVLTILEVTLSFDNAVVNARVLERMNETWQRRFMTWGILIAVFGTRFVLPILIVAIATTTGPYEVAKLALGEPEAYGELLHGVHELIASFGGMFLLMVALKYFFDSAKETHWIAVIERTLARFGKIEAIEIGIALTTLAVVAWLAKGHAEGILFSGIIGILLFVAMQGVSKSFERAAKGVVAATGAGSFALFMYLEVLDSAFSLDGVIGAFAITTDLPIIAAGLGIGALFVRSLTIYMVRERTLDTLIYLEHGAHWAILGLAGAMLSSIFLPVPETVTGFIGIAFVIAAYWSSLRARPKTAVS